MNSFITVCDGDCIAAIDPIGAQCMQFSHTALGVNVLHNSEKSRVLSGIPILFPVNRIDGGRFSFAGVSYQLPVNDEAFGCSIHGTLYTMPFSVVQKKNDGVTFRFDSEGDYFGFPQSFSVDVAYRIDRASLHQTVRITNLSGPDLPLLLGFHTSFAIPFCPGSLPEDVTVTAKMGAVLARDARGLTVGRADPDELFDRLCNGTYRAGAPVSRQFLASDDGEMTLFDHRAKVGVRYTPDPSLRYRLVFSRGGEYLCLEPQTCAVNAVNLCAQSSDASVSAIAVGETASYHSVISICTE